MPQGIIYRCINLVSVDFVYVKKYAIYSETYLSRDLRTLSLFSVLFTRREGNPGARVTQARGLPLLALAHFFFFTRRVYKVLP